MHFWNIFFYQESYEHFLYELFHKKTKTLVFTPNPEILYKGYHDREFLEILRQATYNVPDGNGLYVASYMQEGKTFLGALWNTYFHAKKTYKKYGERVCGSDLTQDIFAKGYKYQVPASSEPLPVLIIDRKNEHPSNAFEIKKTEVQKSMKAFLEKKYPHTKIHVIFDGAMSAEEIAKFIQKNKIAFVFSSLGIKKQEQSLIEIFSFLPIATPVIGLGVGASIDFLLGLQKRAPQIWRSLGFEWLYRLILQPRIRMKRVYTACVKFPLLISRTYK